MHEWLESLNLFRLVTPTPYILAFFMAFLISYLGTFFMQRLSIKIGFSDKPAIRKFHEKSVALGGGIPIYIGFAAAILFIGHFSTAQKGIVIGGLITLIIGFLDDIKKDFIPATVKLIVLFCTDIFLNQSIWRNFRPIP